MLVVLPTIVGMRATRAQRARQQRHSASMSRCRRQQTPERPGGTHCTDLYTRIQRHGSDECQSASRAWLVPYQRRSHRV